MHLASVKVGEEGKASTQGACAEGKISSTFGQNVLKGGDFE